MWLIVNSAQQKNPANEKMKTNQEMVVNIADNHTITGSYEIWVIILKFNEPTKKEQQDMRCPQCGEDKTAKNGSLSNAK